MILHILRNLIVYIKNLRLVVRITFLKNFHRYVELQGLDFTYRTTQKCIQITV